MDKATASGRSADAARFEEEYERWHRALELYVLRNFGGLSEEDREDVCQEAWEALHEYRRARGTNGYKSPLRFLERVARNRAIARRRRNGHGASSDGLESALSDLVQPDEAAESAIADEEVERMLEALPDEEQAVVKLDVCWGWPRAEVQRILGITYKRYDLVHARALQRVARSLQESESPVWTEARKRLLDRIASGSAHTRQLHAARGIAETDPELHAALTNFGHALHALGAAIPADVALRARGGSLVHHIAYVAERAKESALGIAGRGGSEAGDAVGALATGGGARGAGAATAGVAAKLAGLGAGAKGLLAVCGAGAAASVCLATGVVPGVDLADLNGGGKERAEREAAAEASETVPTINSTLPPVAPEPEPRPEPPPPPPPDPAPPPPEPVVEASPQEEEFGTAGAASRRSAQSSSGAEEPAASPKIEEFGP